MNNLNGWLKLIVGALLVPVLAAIVAIIVMFPRLSALERQMEAKPDSASVNALRRDMNELRLDIRELRSELRR